MKHIPQMLPLKLKTNTHKLSRLYSHNICSICVLWLIYNPNKRIIIDYGSSRARGDNYHSRSTHAEEQAWNVFKKLKNNHKLEIYIWRWDKLGNYKKAYCCNRCSMLAKKYGFENNIYTYEGTKKTKAVIDNPTMSLGYVILHNL